MHDVLRERLSRHLDALPEEQLYQVLDYIEFLSSKYARDQVRPASSSLQRFGERLEDKLRGQRLGITAIRGTMTAMGTADRFMSGIADAGRSFLRDVSATDPAGGAEQRSDSKMLPPPQQPQPVRPEDLPADG
ncbi:hypothetical protein BH23GEM8_BH23GEM8_17910 [soil metagenome]